MNKIYKLRRLMISFMFLGIGILIGRFNNPLLLSTIGCIAMVVVIIYDFKMEGRFYDQNAQRNQ